MADKEDQYKDKSKFIKEILDYSLKKKVDIKTKERLINLIGKEIEKTGNVGDEILNRLERLEGLLIEKPIVKNENKKIKNKQNEYIPPKNLYSFLYEYNQNPLLKYTCHEIDETDIIEDINKRCGTDSYDFNKHQDLIEKAFKDLTKRYFLNIQVYALFKTYIDGGDSKEWSEDKIKINWKSSELVEWSKNNLGIPPNIGDNLRNHFRNNGFEIDAFTSLLSENRVTTFSELVLHFKYLFHIKADNPLQKLIEHKNKKEKWDEKIDFKFSTEFRNNIDLFTDVGKLIQAYKKIIKMILEVSNNTNKPEVELSFIEEEDENSVSFKIHHKNSIFKKSINSTIDRLGESFSDVIKNQINGLCDFYVKANFGNNEYAEINIWNGEEMKAKSIDSFIGVMYILKFKRQ